MGLPKIISIAALKGGTGKTTCTFQIACGLARTYKVLVIDLDPQCNISSNLKFNIFEDNPGIYTVSDIFDNFDTDPCDIVVPGPLEELPNLDFFPSNFYIHGTEQVVWTRTCRERIISNYIHKNTAFFEFYDYVIFDTGPNMGIINQNAFFASDHIILVLDPSTNSAYGAEAFIRLWKNVNAYNTENTSDKIDALIVNNYERINIAKDLEEFLMSHEKFSKITLSSKIIHTTRFKESDSQNKPVYYMETKTRQQLESKERAINCIDSVIQELIERGIL